MTRSTAVLLPLLAALALSAPATAQDGYADSDFGTDGLQIIGWSGDTALASSLRALGDGSLYVGGEVEGASGQDLGVTRLTGSGALDLAWGSLGRRRVAIDAVADAADQLLALSPLPDGALLLAGLSTIDSDNFLQLPAVAKLTSGGDLDPSFGDSGVAVLDLPWTTDSYGWQGALVQPDGKVVFYGYCYDCPDNASDWHPMLLRVTTAGAPDPSFSGDGWEAPTGGVWGGAYPHDLRLDGAGRLLVLGQNNGFSIVRLLASGALDTTFGGGDGLAPFAMPTGHAHPYKLAVDPNTGSIFVSMAFSSGAYDDHGGVVRLSSGGVLDTTFAGDGLAELVFDARLWVNAMEVQSDGKPIGVGLINVSIPGTSDFFLFRLKPDGGFDETFHANGVRRVSFEQDPDGSDFATAMTLSGGRLVAAGWATVGPDVSFGITRTTSELVFTDGFERGSTSGWSGH
jgi:uncharacterized delta-60 repeat protein